MLTCLCAHGIMSHITYVYGAINAYVFVEVFYMYRKPDKCPVCESELKITKMTCDRCGTEISGEFSGCRFCSLSKEMSDYLIVFLKCRGNIKEIEKELGISYPTVRGYTENLLSALGLNESVSKEPYTKANIFKMLERKEITAHEAACLIKELEE